MMRSTAGVLALTLAATLLSLVGCGEEPFDPNGNRFAAEGDEIVGKGGPAKDDACEAGVCAPPPASKGDNAQPDASPASGAGGCEAKNTCATAVDLGSIKGDTGGDTRSEQGVGSRFFDVDVTEADTGATGTRMKVAVTLVSPKTTNYDLFVYSTDCSAPDLSSTQPAGSTDKLLVEWGEGGGYNPLSNGADDRKTLHIEVRRVSTTCDPDDEWTLILQGNGT